MYCSEPLSDFFSWNALVFQKSLFLPNMIFNPFRFDALILSKFVTFYSIFILQKPLSFYYN